VDRVPNNSNELLPIKVRFNIDWKKFEENNHNDDEQIQAGSSRDSSNDYLAGL
jgi:hypothetical protein